MNCAYAHEIYGNVIAVCFAGSSGCKTVRRRENFLPGNEKCRFVCAEYKYSTLSPAAEEKAYMELQIDELEALRLCDFEEMEQEVAAHSMNISRGTLQRILYTARHKVAEALMEGKGIIITGGNYQVSPGCRCSMKCKKCRKEVSENE